MRSPSQDSGSWRCGFPTGQKWASPPGRGDTKYVVCNADEGERARTWTDRARSDPHAIIEGMLIGSYSIGAREGYIYVRSEYRGHRNPPACH